MAAAQRLRRPSSAQIGLFERQVPDRSPLVRSCLYCWGQRRIIEPARNGEGMIAAPCPDCGGTGMHTPRHREA